MLAIDPGYDRLGVSVLSETIGPSGQGSNGKPILIFSDCIVTDRKAEHGDRLLAVGRCVNELIQKFSPDVVAIEELFFSKNVKTALLVSQALGVVAYEAAQAGLEIFYYKPNQVKVAVTGYGASDKAQVTTMVTRLIKISKKIQHDDEYDAIAVGLTHLACRPKIQARNLANIKAAKLR